MIQAVNTDAYSYTSAISASNNSTAKITDTETDKQAATGRSARTDTVEISEQARAAMQANSVASAGSKVSDADSTQQGTAPAMPSASSAQTKSSTLKAVTAVTDSTDSDESPVLSTLSEAEMDELVSQGVITKGQEQAELVRRAAEKQQEQNVQQNETSRSLNQSSQKGIEAYQAQAVGSPVSETFFNSVA